MQSRLLPPRGLAYHAVALALGLAGGCNELVDLGSECPGNVSFCPEGAPVDPSLPMGPPSSLDADVPVVDGRTADATQAENGDGGRRPGPDAGLLGDRSGDASVAMLPALLNRSFELTQGAPGDITAISLPSFTAIAPWYTCQPIGQGSPGVLTAVRAEQSLADAPIVLADAAAPAPITPTHAETFVSIRYFVNVVQVPLIQRLGAPLEAGTRYAFAVDVRTTSPRTHLALQVTGGDDCLGVTSQPEVLHTSTPIVRGGWQRMCISFVPSRTYNLIGLAAVSAEAISNDVLLLDNMGEASDCL